MNWPLVVCIVGVIWAVVIFFIGLALVQAISNKGRRY